MNNWSEIISQISVKQRVFALFLILLFPVISFLGGKFLDNNNCRGFINENKLLHKDLAEISRLIREEKTKEIREYNDYQIIPDDSTNVVDKTIFREPILETILRMSNKP